MGTGNSSYYYGTLIVSAIIFVVFVECGSSSKMRCPRNIKIEKGGSKTITCTFMEEQPDSLYWYKGNTASTGPILQLEKGQIGGSEHGKGHYTITDTGAMNILNASVEQEALYSVLAYFRDENFESKVITINVTITPSPPCPKIDLCDSCDVCRKTSITIGNLTCRIDFARPILSLKWIIVSKMGIGLTVDSPTIQKDVSTNTWNTSVTLSYEAFSCNQQATLQCVAQDDLNILEHTVSSVKLYTDNCSDNKGNDTNSLQYGRVVIAVVCPIAVTAFLLTCLCCYIGLQRNHRLNNPDFRSCKLSEQKTLGHSLLSAENMSDNDYEVKHFESCLENFYKSMNYNKLLPWAKKVPFGAFYTACDCQVTFGKENEVSVKSDDLFSRGKVNIRNDKQVLITGECEFGRTMLAKHFLQQWAQEKNHDFICIYLPLNRADHSTRISDLWKNDEDLIRYSDGDIKEFISHYKCLIILDGLDKVNLVSEEGIGRGSYQAVTSGSDGMSPPKHSDNYFTVKDVLDMSRQSTYLNLQVWATAREMRQTFSRFFKFNTYVKITGYSEAQMEYCVLTTCTFYGNLKNSLDDCYDEQSKSKINKGGLGGEENSAKLNNCESGSINKTEVIEPSFDGLKCTTKDEANIINTNDERTKYLYSQAHEILAKHCIYDEFKEDPYILLLIIHIACANVSDILCQFQHVQITKISKLMHVVVACLEHEYVQNYGESNFSKVKFKLGEVAYNLIFSGNPLCVWHLPSSIDKNPDASSALAIGLLKRMPNEDKNGEFSSTEVLFRHKLFKDYLAAAFVDQHATHFDKLMESLKKEKRDPDVGVLKFITCNQSQLERLYNDLMELKMYNNVIACIHGREDYNETQGILKTFCTSKIYLARLASKQHQNAVRTFLALCKSKDIKLRELYFQQSCSIEILESFEFPKVETLGFFRKSFSEKDFVSILRFVYKSEVTSQLSFQECQVPMELSIPVIKAVKEKHGTHVRVRKQNDIADVFTTQLNYDTGRWVYF